MKWFFALSEASLGHPGHDWESLIRVALRSARARTSLEPHFVYDGAENSFTAELRAAGVVIHPHRVTFYNALVENRRRAVGHADPMYVAIAAGAYLRCEIPLIETADEFVLYTDCDVMFLADPPVAAFRPAFFACAPQRDRADYVDFNTGVMVMNLPALRSTLPPLVSFIGEHSGRFGAFDQDAYREGYPGQCSPLPPELNWKPYWGASPSASIVHFHGPKPSAARRLRDDPGYAPPPIWRELYLENPAGYAAYLEQWEQFAGA